MFGTNQIVGKSFFRDAPEKSLFVTSIFFTIQGEGPYAGLPALFVRLAKCNLNCKMCDTFFDQGDWLTFEQIEKKAYSTISDYWNLKGNPVPIWAVGREWSKPSRGDESLLGPYPGVVLVITGGEPLLQDNLTEFLVRQQGRYKAVQIESNGILATTPIPNYVTLVCSPKCSEKDGSAIKYLTPSKDMLARATCLKFVMSADQESPYYLIPQWAHEWKRKTGREVYCSPMNVYNEVPQKAKELRLARRDGDGNISLEERSTVDEVISFWAPGLLNLEKNQANHEYTAKYALDNGFRLTLQMHLYASLA